MTFQETYEKLASIGQEHILKFYDELSENEKTALLAQIEKTDFSVLDSLKSGGAASLGRGEITPLKACEIPEIEANYFNFTKTGLDQLRAGKACAVLLAGGMGTRLGSSDPKGMYDIGITHHVYIFQRLFENLIPVCEDIHEWIHLFIMTSEKNDAATQEFIRKHRYFGYEPEYVHFFQQDMAPVVDDKDHKILMESKGRIATSPNGNGGWFSSMARSGLVDFLHLKGIEWINVFSVDNVLQNICDPTFLGAVIDRRYASGSKVVRKDNPDEKVGVMCLEDGKPSVIEYIEMTDEMRNETDEFGDYLYNFGVILNYMFKVGELEKIMNEKLLLHFAHKKVSHIDENGRPVNPAEPNAIKFELFILDMIHSLPGCLPYEVERLREFAPIKNKIGTDSVESARDLCRLNGIYL